MDMVTIYHPALKREVEVPESSVQVLIMSGWQRADKNESEKIIKDLEDRLKLERSALVSAGTETLSVPKKEESPKSSGKENK